MYQYCFSSAGRGNGRGAMPFLMSLALEHEIVTLAWIDNASVQFPLNIYATKVFIRQFLGYACLSLESLDRSRCLVSCPCAWFPSPCAHARDSRARSGPQD